MYSTNDYYEMFRKTEDWSHYSQPQRTQKAALGYLNQIIDKAEDFDLIAYSLTLKAKLLLRQHRYLEAVKAAEETFSLAPNLYWASYYWLVSHKGLKLNRRNREFDWQEIWLEALECAIRRADNYAYHKLIRLPEQLKDMNREGLAKLEHNGSYHNSANLGIEYSLLFLKETNRYPEFLNTQKLLDYLKRISNPAAQRPATQEVFFILKLQAIRSICLEKNVSLNWELFKFVGHFIYRSQAPDLRQKEWLEAVATVEQIIQNPKFELPEDFLSREMSEFLDQIQENLFDLWQSYKMPAAIFEEQTSTLRTRDSSQTLLKPGELEVIYEHSCGLQELAVINFELLP